MSTVDVDAALAIALRRASAARADRVTLWVMATANPLPELERALHKLVQLEPLTPDERALVQRRLDEAPIDDVDHSLTPEDIDELAQGMAEAEEEQQAGTLRPVGELLARLRQIEAS